MSEEQIAYAENKDLAMITHQAQVSMFLNEQRFEFAQRIGKMIAASTMVPEHFRNNLGNCMIALNLAERLGLDVFGLMSTSYVVKGRPGFEAKLLIAIFNARTQLFIPPIRWEFKGDFPKGKDAGCRAYAVDRETKEPLYGEWIDWDLVKAEGWDQNSKWRNMPGQMYRYRAASFFINAYEPGLKLGIMTVDELQDSIIDVTPEKVLPKSGNGEKATYDIKDAEPEPKETEQAEKPTSKRKKAVEVKPDEPEKVTVVTEPVVNSNEEMIECPNQGGKVGINECESCAEKPRCPEWTVYA